MAFSTQREFFPVPMEIEQRQLQCRDACIKLKSYESTFDGRSWAQDTNKLSSYLTDLITWCKAPLSGWQHSESRMDYKQMSGQSPALQQQSLYGNLGFNDSLMETARAKFSQIQLCFGEKEKLEMELSASGIVPETTQDKFEQLERVTDKNFDQKQINDMMNKLQQIIASSNLSKTEGDDLRNFQQFVKDLTLRNQYLEAQRMMLQRLVAKIGERSQFDDIKVEPETSTDIQYLQNQVNTLRKEVLHYRKGGNQPQGGAQGSGGGHTKSTQATKGDQDLENVQRIMKERAALRKRLEEFEGLEQKICEFQRRMRESGNLEDGLRQSVECQASYINELESQLSDLERYCAKLEENHNKQTKCLKDKLRMVECELCRYKMDVRKTEQLQLEVDCLHRELKDTEKQLLTYEHQFQQIRIVIKTFIGNGYRMYRNSYNDRDELIGRLSGLI